MRAGGHAIFELLHANISCALPYMSVFAHLLLLAYVRGMMRFTSNAPQVENILSKNTSADLPENLYNDVFNLHANGSVPDFPFLSPFGYAG